jgi:hypothetical protein
MHRNIELEKIKKLPHFHPRLALIGNASNFDPRHGNPFLHVNKYFIKLKKIHLETGAGSGLSCPAQHLLHPSKHYRSKLG